MILIAFILSIQQSVGRWEILGVISPVVCIHTILLPDSRVLCAERPHPPPYPVNPLTQGATTAEINLLTGDVAILNLARDPFCGGHAQMANGDILFVGGDTHLGSTQVPLVDGRTAIRLFRSCQIGPGCPQDNKWVIESYELFSRRWYPTVTTLKDGRQLITSGSTAALNWGDFVTNNPTYEYYPRSINARERFLQVLDDLYPYSLYPHQFQMPEGDVMLFVANRTVFLNTDTDVVTETVPVLNMPNHRPWIYPNTPTMVMLPLTRANNYKAEFLMCGGNRDVIRDGVRQKTEDADARCVLFSRERGRWEETESMPTIRVMPDSVILPDQTILFTNGALWGEAGGSAGDPRSAPRPNFASHLYDPKKPVGSRWSTVAPASIARLYHSGALLLEDGRVVTSGNEVANYLDVINNNERCYPQNATNIIGFQDTFERRFEAFSPPYMFLDIPQHVIETKLVMTTYKSTFSVHLDLSNGNPDARRVSFVSLIRYGTSTHSTNMDQRLVELKVAKRNLKTLILEAPESGSIAPPGNYHLFLLNGGKPSKAIRVNLQLGDPQEAETITDVVAECADAKCGGAFSIVLSVLHWSLWLLLAF